MVDGIYDDSPEMTRYLARLFADEDRAEGRFVEAPPAGIITDEAIVIWRTEYADQHKSVS